MFLGEGRRPGRFEKSNARRRARNRAKVDLPLLLGCRRILALAVAVAADRPCNKKHLLEAQRFAIGGPTEIRSARCSASTRTSKAHAHPGGCRACCNHRVGEPAQREHDLGMFPMGFRSAPVSRPAAV